MKHYAILFMAALLSPLSFAQYRCSEDGRTVVTDRPCANQSEQTGRGAKNVVGDSANSAYATTSGAWRGQVQFMAKQGTAVVTEAHAVVPLVIDIDPRGKVAGISTETGCAFKEIATPSVMDTITNPDVTLTGCKYPGYNRQLTGRLALYKAQKYTDLNLVAYDVNRRPPGSYEITGTLRR